LVGKPQWEAWEDNVKIDLREMGLLYMNWVEVDQDGVLWKASVDLCVPKRQGIS
jgi:hypothetical protein